MGAVSVGAVVVTLVALPVLAADYGGGNVQGYSAEQAIDPGTVVELTGEGADRVKVASQAALENMFGVVVDPQQLSVRITNDARENETYVAVSGTYNVLVSTQAGAIAPGDYLTLSAISGVAMKASTEEPTVLGRAQAAFDGTGPTRGTVTLKDTDGNDNATVQLGTVPVTIDIKTNPLEQSTKADVPEFLERVGQAIAEKEVSPVRIYLSVGITTISLIAAIIVIYTGVRNSVISIGRNPMSKKSIFRALFEIILTSALILIIGLFAVYLLLRL